MRSVMINQRLASAGRLPMARLLSPLAFGAYLVKLWQSNRERRDLAELDPRLLRDIGIDPMAAAHEVERPFWQLTAHHEAELRRQLRL
jgi:uncharacterized protein YjiS (DUF1127 family)